MFFGKDLQKFANLSLNYFQNYYYVSENETMSLTQTSTEVVGSSPAYWVSYNSYHTLFGLLLQELNVMRQLYLIKR